MIRTLSEGACPKTRKSIFKGREDDVDTMSEMKDKMVSKDDFAARLKTKVGNENPRELVFGQPGGGGE